MAGRRAADVGQVASHVYEHFRQRYRARHIVERREDLVICAAVEQSFGPKSTSTGAAYRCYRIALWVEGAPGGTRAVDYDLHPEYGALRKRSIAAPHFEHWVLSYDDFWIRVRTGEGVEFGCWLTNALDEGLKREQAGPQRRRETADAIQNLRLVASKLLGWSMPPEWVQRGERPPWTGRPIHKVDLNLMDDLNKP